MVKAVLGELGWKRGTLTWDPEEAGYCSLVVPFPSHSPWAFDTCLPSVHDGANTAGLNSRGTGVWGSRHSGGEWCHGRSESDYLCI